MTKKIIKKLKTPFEDDTVKIIIHTYKTTNQDTSLVTIGWKKIELKKKRIAGDYIIVPIEVIPEIIRQLKLIK